MRCGVTTWSPESVVVQATSKGILVVDTTTTAAAKDSLYSQAEATSTKHDPGSYRRGHTRWLPDRYSSQCVGAAKKHQDRHCRSADCTRLQVRGPLVLPLLDCALNAPFLETRFHFDPTNAESIDALHERCAARLLRVCEANGGLYVKLGQAIGVQAAILPKPYHALSKMFDDAERMPVSVVRGVVEKELGKTIEEVSVLCTAIGGCSFLCCVLTPTL